MIKALKLFRYKLYSSKIHMIIILTSFALIVFCFPWLQNSLEFNKSRVLQGEFWRLLTCNWTHYSFEHLFWSSLAFALPGYFCWRNSPKRFIAVIIISALIIPVFILIFMPDMHYYRGLSGIDAALFSLLFIDILIEKVKKGEILISFLCCLLFVGLIMKIIYELSTGSAFFVDVTLSKLNPVPEAHIIGALIGLTIGCLHFLRNTKSIKNKARKHKPSDFK